jgi:phosphoglycerol transferase MdoB-like AlkP superfamily enzyme
MKPILALLDSAPAAAAVSTYLAYLFISVALTIWVARTLHKNGRIFLVDSFLGNEPLADSVNHLLVVGFYLINIGFVTLALKYGDKATDTQTALEILSTKVGLVLVVLGIMHFINLATFSKMRRRATPRPTTGSLPPVLPRGA